jgi:hypothetical protein
VIEMPPPGEFRPYLRGVLSTCAACPDVTPETYWHPATKIKLCRRCAVANGVAVPERTKDAPGEPRGDAGGEGR